MNGRIVSICLVAVLLSCVLPYPGSVHADAPDDTFYCYGNTAHCKYPGTNLDEVEVVWKVYDANGSPVPFTEVEKGYITVDASELDEIHVVQTVSRGEESDSITMRIIPLHFSAEKKVTVEFIDHGRIIDTAEISNTTVVRYGDDHVVAPNLADRIGETFMGWFIDQELTKPFDPKQPILEDTKVYSKWVTAAEPDGDIIVGGKVIVTFYSVPGLTHLVTGQGEDWISFQIVTKEGYLFHEGSLSASADGIPIIGTEGVYRIECKTDIDVLITGERSYSITYDLTNVVISADGFDKLPSNVPRDGVSFHIETGGDISIRVYQDGEDITSSCVSGNVIELHEVEGNIVIVASTDVSHEGNTPLWWMLVVIVIIGLVASVMIIRKNISNNH